MKLLVIGSGGREHALAWKLKQSTRVSEVLVAPGNAGTALEPGLRNVAVAVDDLDGLVALATRERIDLTVVGPELPLVLGVVDRFAAHGLAIFGPSQAAARLEGSKAFAKQFLQQHRIPTAAYGVFTELAAARAYLHTQGAPIVIKADGLAAGKGVVVAMTVAEAEAALVAMFRTAGARVLIEEFLVGEEASYIALCDGEHALAMATSQDHKRRDDGDQGPNTGGMGAYSPAPVVSTAIDTAVMASVIRPTLAGMAAAGTPFRGFLYAGLMIAADGSIKVLEFNTRLGDPEAQPLLLRLRSDLLDPIEAALAGRLDQCRIDWDPRPALGVVLAAHGYPEAPRAGDPIDGLSHDPGPDCKIFHSGTRVAGDRIVSSGGRVLSACALGDNLDRARERAYAALAQIELKGSFFRHDIGHRALKSV